MGIMISVEMVGFNPENPDQIPDGLDVVLRSGVVRKYICTSYTHLCEINQWARQRLLTYNDNVSTERWLLLSRAMTLDTTSVFDSHSSEDMAKLIAEIQSCAPITPDDHEKYGHFLENIRRMFVAGSTEGRIVYWR